MKVWILFLAFNASNNEIPEGWPNKGTYYHSAADCHKAAERHMKKGVAKDARCVSVVISK